MFGWQLFSLKTVISFLGVSVISLGPIVYSVQEVNTGGGIQSNKHFLVENAKKRETVRVHDEKIELIDRRVQEESHKPLEQEVNNSEQMSIISEKIASIKNTLEGANSAVEALNNVTQKIEDSPTLDLTNKKDQNYKKFLDNLLSIMEGAVWINEPYSDLWINQVFVQMPKDKFRERPPHIKHNRVKKAYTSADFSEMSVDNSAEIDIFDMSVSPSKMYSLRSQREDKMLEKLTKMLQSMSDLVHTFLTEDWIPRDRIDSSKESKFVLSPISIRTTKTGGSGGFWIENVLRFIRVYGGKYYYCDIYFTSGMQKNMIRSNYVYYRDKNWREGAYYQANGDWGYYGKNIGGDGRYLWWNRRSWNSIDTEFSTLFDSKEDRPKQLWKWFEVISKCLRVKECQQTLHSSSYSMLSQKNNPISRNDSYKKDIYERIHPFSNIYHEVNDQLNTQELIFSF